MAHSSQMIYTRMIGDAPEDEKENEGGVVVSFAVVHAWKDESDWTSFSFKGGEERKRKEGQVGGQSTGEGWEGAGWSMIL